MARHMTSTLETGVCIPSQMTFFNIYHAHDVSANLNEVF